MKITSLYPVELKDFLQEIEGLGFSLCLVGGAPRDFLMSGKLSTDLDFEVRGQKIERLLDFLKAKKISYQELPYRIIRVDLKGFDLEFSLPRMEIPTERKSHHHFEAKLDPDLSYDQAFMRRDFTLNAIGIEFSLKNDVERIVDPFNGKDDLKNNLLREINDYFFQDPVRLLRLIRFTIKYHFNISESIKKKAGDFNLEELSVHYFKEEMRKSGNPGGFINYFNDFIRTYPNTHLKKEFSFWNEFHFSDKSQTQVDILAEAFLQNSDKAPDVIKFFSLPEKKLKDLQSFDHSYQVVKSLSNDSLRSLVKDPLTKSSDLSVLKELKNLEDKKEWRKYYSSSLPISWGDWESITVNKNELDELSPELRSYFRFYQAVKKVVPLG